VAEEILGHRGGLESWAGQPLATPTYSIGKDTPFSFVARQGEHFATTKNKSKIIEGVVVQVINNFGRGLLSDGTNAEGGYTAIKIYPTSDDRASQLPVVNGPTDAGLCFYPTYISVSTDGPQSIKVGDKAVVQDYFAYRSFDTSNQPVGTIMSIVNFELNVFPNILALKNLCAPESESGALPPCAISNQPVPSGTGTGKPPVSVPDNRDKTTADWVSPSFVLEPIGMNAPTNRYTAGRGGDRVHPKGHAGCDFGAPLAAPVYAAFSGEAEFRMDNALQSDGTLGGAGWYILMEHDQFVQPFYTMYGHLSLQLTPRAFGLDPALANPRGAKRKFKKGEVIGYIYNQTDIDLKRTGRTTGPHLHFEVHMDASPFSNRAAPLESFYFENSSPGLQKGPPPSANFRATGSYHLTPNKFQLKPGGEA
jgi:murein DD-endopeptidase MepM/ murein hydrolase activator NlpD